MRGFLISTIFLLGLAVGLLYKNNYNLKAEIVILKHEKQLAIDKAVEDVKNVRIEGERVVEMTRKDFQLKNDSLSHKLDSVTNKAGIGRNAVESATFTSTRYVDTTLDLLPLIRPKKWQGIDLNVLAKPDTIKFSKYQNCWGVEGYTLTRDPMTLIYVTKKISNNNIIEVKTKERKLWFIVIKRAKSQLFSECGDPLIVTTKFKNE